MIVRRPRQTSTCASAVHLQYLLGKVSTFSFLITFFIILYVIVFFFYIFIFIFIIFIYF